MRPLFEYNSGPEAKAHRRVFVQTHHASILIASNIELDLGMNAPQT